MRDGTYGFVREVSIAFSRNILLVQTGIDRRSTTLLVRPVGIDRRSNIMLVRAIGVDRRFTILLVRAIGIHTAVHYTLSPYR